MQMASVVSTPTFQFWTRTESPMATIPTPTLVHTATVISVRGFESPRRTAWANRSWASEEAAARVIPATDDSKVMKTTPATAE